MKIKSKITFLYVLLVTAILSLLSYSVYYFTSLERAEAFKKRLKGRANSNAQIFSMFDDVDSSGAVLSQLDSTALNILLPRKSVSIYNYLDEPVYTFQAENAEPLAPDRQVLKDARLKGEVYFRIKKRDAIAFHHTDERNRIVVVVAAYDEDGWERLSQLGKILIMSLFIGIAITLLTGYLFSAQLIRPISQIIHEVNDISSQNLSHRIKAGTSQDELNQLANTFNELLNRLQESFTIQRRFISNASHELSTPLTSIKSQLDVTLQKDRDIEEYKQVMQSIREDVEQMQQLTRGLLEIAKAGSQGSIELLEIRVDEVLIKVVSDLQKSNANYKTELHFGDFPEDEKTFLVFGNYELLYSSLKNIVENGCKYSPDNMSVVELFFQDNEVYIRVSNKGDVIAEEEVENIFQPFYRSESASSVRGFGLGLPLARRIISLHKGYIAVQSDVITGTVFTIVLPSVKAFSER